jgi:hypothetical protein
MGTSAGKRQREREKLDKARAKAERRATRQAADADADVAPELTSHRSESELIDDLGALHRTFEAGDLSLEDFEERRNLLQAQLGQLTR